MRKLGIGLAVLLVVLVAAVLVVPALVPADTYKGLIESEAKRATGRDLRIAGPVRFSVFPRLGLTVEKAALANVPGAADPDLARIARLDLALKLGPLLQGQAVVDRVVLVDPVINLEVDAQGHPNWHFSPQQAPAGQAAPAGKPATKSGRPLTLHAARIENGQATYLDRRTAKREEVDAIGADLAWPDGGPLGVTGQATWHGQRLQLSVDAKAPDQMLNGGDSPLKATVQGAPFKATFDGHANGGALPKAEGAVALTAPSVKDLLAWVGAHAPGGDALGALSLSSNVSTGAGAIHLADLKLALADTHASGDLTLSSAGPRTGLRGRLEADRLDATPFLGAAGAPPAGARPQGAPASGQPAPAPATGWSDAPISFVGLANLDLDLGLKLGALKVKQIAIGQSSVQLRASGGKLVADLQQLALYGGAGKGSVTLDGSGAVPGAALVLALSGIDAKPLLGDAIGVHALSGKGAIDLDLTTRGASERAMVDALGGRGRLSLQNGSVEGLDLAAMVQNAAEAFTQSSAGGGATQFADLSASVAIANGVARTDDLKLTAPLVQVAGAGTVDLPRRTLDMRLTPTVGQGIRGNGITVPVLVRGPLDHPTYAPDVQGLVEQRGGKLLDQLKGKIGPAAGTSSGKPADILRGLLGR